MNIIDRLKNGWNAFQNKDPTYNKDIGASSYYRPDRIKLISGNERTIISSIFNRIALDVSQVKIKHCLLDDNERYSKTINSGLNNCLNVSANLDQTGRAFIQDVCMSLMDEGCVAIVPIDTDDAPTEHESVEILSLRVAKITQWYPNYIQVYVYNERTGHKDYLNFRKDTVAIIENPFYAVMNGPNSTLKRLVRKLALLDATDEKIASNKLDLIIQLPYIVKTEARKKQAEIRRKEMEDQLTGSAHGIAYTDGSEKITQLNRPVENNLMSQIEYLTNQLFAQLNITQGILDGTADEKTMLNYTNRTIEPIISAIIGEMNRKFLSQNARTRGQALVAFNDPFRLVPINNIAEIADKFTRNEILTSNEIRQIIGMKPSDDPKADQLINSNISQPNEEPEGPDQNMVGDNDILSDIEQSEKELDDLESELNHSETLMHYASKYYDPKKAHEYYMRTRELSDRKSTSSLNDTGKEIAKNVKDNLDAERAQKVELHKDQTKNKIDQLSSSKQQQIESNREIVNNKIQSLRDQLKSMSSAEKKANKEFIQSIIDGLRDQNKKDRLELQESFSNDRKSLNDAHSEKKKALKEEYDEKYLQELDKIRSESEYVKKSKKKKSYYTTGG